MWGRDENLRISRASSSGLCKDRQQETLSQIRCKVDWCLRLFSAFLPCTVTQVPLYSWTLAYTHKHACMHTHTQMLLPWISRRELFLALLIDEETEAQRGIWSWLQVPSLNSLPSVCATWQHLFPGPSNLGKSLEWRESISSCHLLALWQTYDGRMGCRPTIPFYSKVAMESVFSGSL